MLSLQLLAEERVGSELRAKTRREEAKFAQGIDALRRDTQRERAGT